MHRVTNGFYGFYSLFSLKTFLNFLEVLLEVSTFGKMFWWLHLLLYVIEFTNLEDNCHA